MYQVNKSPPAHSALQRGEHSPRQTCRRLVQRTQPYWDTARGGCLATTGEMPPPTPTQGLAAPAGRTAGFEQLAVLLSSEPHLAGSSFLTSVLTRAALGKKRLNDILAVIEQSHQ